ncbi:unnamed protein product [Rotaria socialis]|uniref:SWIM-type domain-containing protein n=3 Tax=Rotaria socialis TaxID=392032 RepID=A0A818EE37_9BILA|nr:unnamed protein product [Rotaria socialis]
MQNDFDHLDVLVNKTDPQENEEPMLLEVNTDIVTENENMESEKEESQEVEEMKSVKLSIWRTSEPHGSYQIKMAKCYIIEHIRQPRTNEEEMEFIVECCNEHDDLVRARFQSRHSNSKNHIATVQFDHHKQQPTDAWYCTCSAAAREVGMCSHVTALRWHLGVNKAVISTDNHPLSASRLIKAIDDSTHFSEDDLS